MPPILPQLCAHGALKVIKQLVTEWPHCSGRNCNLWSEVREFHLFQNCIASWLMAATIIAGVCEDHQDYELIRHDQTSQNWEKRETEQDCLMKPCIRLFYTNRGWLKLYMCKITSPKLCIPAGTTWCAWFPSKNPPFGSYVLEVHLR